MSIIGRPMFEMAKRRWAFITGFVCFLLAVITAAIGLPWQLASALNGMGLAAYLVWLFQNPVYVSAADRLDIRTKRRRP